MENKTESYIVLKPIAERFSRVANKISDDEIKFLIKDEMRQQLKGINFSHVVQEIVDEYLEEPDNVENIIKTISDSIKERFK